MIKKTMKKALETWGLDSQILMSIEEMAELTQALLKQHFREYKPYTKEQVIDEIADVEIMMIQMKMIYGEELIEKRISEKIERLQKRLE